MAEGNTANENSENKLNEIVKSNQKYITPTFNNTDLFYLLFAFAILIADITTGQSKIYNSFVFVLYSTGVFPTTSPALSRVRENSKLTVAVFFADIILIVQYSISGEIIWAAGTFILVIFPESVMQIISLRWHKFDDKISVSHYIFHTCCLGLIRR